MVESHKPAPIVNHRQRKQEKRQQIILAGGDVRSIMPINTMNGTGNRPDR
jgi:hypothetical protein